MAEERFAFGKNWAEFLENVTEEQLQIAHDSLLEAIDEDEFKGKLFLDIGSGSGVFSLAAHRLGARVFSFDYDPDSVACTQSLKDKFAPDSDWVIEQGSILDKQYLSKLEKAEIVYSWGVLHSTGDMYQAFENIIELVKPRGILFIAIYNDMGDEVTNEWMRVKKQYVNGNDEVKKQLIKKYLHHYWGRKFTDDFFETGDPLKRWKEYKKYRGMSAYHDVVDWVGGLPYEVATREELTSYFEPKGFELEWLDPNDGTGCNQLMFRSTS